MVDGFILREQFLSKRGQDFKRANVEDGDVAGIVRTPVGKGDHAGAGEGKGAAAASARRSSKMIGNFLERAIDRIETDLGVALIVVTKEDAAVVGSPFGVLDIAVEFIGEGMRIAGVAIHEVEICGLMALVT